jgi:hypothetical protein
MTSVHGDRLTLGILQSKEYHEIIPRGETGLVKSSLRVISWHQYTGTDWPRGFFNPRNIMRSSPRSHVGFEDCRMQRTSRSFPGDRLTLWSLQSKKYHEITPRSHVGFEDCRIQRTSRSFPGDRLTLWSLQSKKYHEIIPRNLLGLEDFPIQGIPCDNSTGLYWSQAILYPRNIMRSFHGAAPTVDEAVHSFLPNARCRKRDYDTTPPNIFIFWRSIN